MVQKRPFDNEELYNISSKHPRQLQKQLVSILEFVPYENASRQLHNFGQDFFKKYKIEVEQNFRCDGISEIPKILDQNLKYSSPEYIMGASPWATHSSSEEEHPPHKLVPIGPNHQAVIPKWSLPDTKIFKDNAMNPIGSCTIPMPESVSSEKIKKNGMGRIDCSCHDVGSIRCVRQHVTESREKLKKTLGHEKFVELGFCSMGEEVAKNWSEDDEHLFHEVVFSNPASIGKNFWEQLSINFPSRTKQDIVSYYFNVFILRRRAEQNRCNSMNIDSDNDEWQESDDDVSDIESPDCTDSNCYTQIRKYDVHGYSNSSFENNNIIVSEIDMGISRPFETFSAKFSNGCSSNHNFDFLGKTTWENLGDHGDSCITSESGSGSQETQTNDDSIHNWDDGYMNFLANKPDFLPTCSVIEEFIGNEDLNYVGRDGNGSS